MSPLTPDPATSGKCSNPAVYLQERELDTTCQVATLRVLSRILCGPRFTSYQSINRRELEPLLGADRHDRVQRGRVLGGEPVPPAVTRPIAGCSGVSDPRVPHVARTRVARAFTPQSVRGSQAVDVELEVVAVWLKVAVHWLRELVAVARNERRQLHLG
jgi:hypothetical protein